MRRIIFVAVLTGVVAFAAPAAADLLGDIMERLSGAAGGTSKAGLDQQTVVSGLKEALSVGTEKAVKSLSGRDGYFGNRMVKILLPEKIQAAADAAGRLGFQKQVDRFVLSMNRAAEAAAPRATALFVDAIRDMSFADARKILQGGDTAATEYFREKTSDRLYDAFQPVISSSMDKVGVAKAYKEMTAPLASLPLLPRESLDLDRYVTGKALDGLFLMVGEEEKKIRTDPAARVTDLLKTVFAK